MSPLSPASQLLFAAGDGFARRVPSPASAISPEFDLARAGGLSPEDSVALYDQRVFVINDLHGGRMLHEFMAAPDMAGQLALEPEAGSWIHSLESDGRGRLTAWNSSPTVEDMTARDFDGRRWRVDAGRQRRVPVIASVRHPTAPLVFQSRRTAPGRSACRVVHDDGSVLARWSCPLMTRGIWCGDRLWYLEEAWPGQRLVGRAGDEPKMVEQQQLPPGNLSSLVAAGSLAAGVWTDPATPATLLVAPTVQDLIEDLVKNITERPGDDGETTDEATRPYRSHCGPIEDIPCVVYTPTARRPARC